MRIVSERLQAKADAITDDMKRRLLNINLEWDSGRGGVGNAVLYFRRSENASLKIRACAAFFAVSEYQSSPLIASCACSRIRQSATRVPV